MSTRAQFPVVCRAPDAGRNPVLQHLLITLTFSLSFVIFGWEQNDVEQTYEAQSSLHSAVNHLLGSSKGNWLIPALHVVCRNTHRAAALADEYVNRSTGNRNDHKRLQNAVTLLQASYSKTLNDRSELRVSIQTCHHPHFLFYHI